MLSDVVNVFGSSVVALILRKEGKRDRQTENREREVIYGVKEMENETHTCTHAQTDTAEAFEALVHHIRIH